MSSWRLRWLALGPALTFVLTALALSCGGGGGNCFGNFDQFGNFLPASCPSSGTVVGYNLQSISVCAGPPPSPTPTPTPGKGKPTPTPTPTACPQATSTAVEVGAQAVFHADGTLVKGKIVRVVDITNNRDVLWTSTSTLLPPAPGSAGVYDAVSQGCACIDASAAGVRAPLVGVTIYSNSAPTPSCPACPTPAAATTPASAPEKHAPASRAHPSSFGEAGALDWAFDAGMPLAGPLAPGPRGRLYFITADGMLHALDGRGRERWRRASGGGAPIIGEDGTVYALGGGGSLQALSPKGRPLWSLALGAGGEPLAASDGAVYARVDGALWALSAPGVVRWRMPAEGDISAAAVAADGAIVAGATGGALTAVSPGGAVRWRFEPEGGFAGGVAALGGRIYAGSGTGALYALDARSGAEIWRLPTLGPARAGPVAGSSALLFFKSDSLYAVGTDGAVVWRRRLSPSGPFAAAGSGGLFAQEPEGADVLFDSDGRVKWTSRIGPAAQMAISSSGVLYVATTDGRVYAIR